MNIVQIISLKKLLHTKVLLVHYHLLHTMEKVSLFSIIILGNVHYLANEKTIIRKARFKSCTFYLI